MQRPCKNRITRVANEDGVWAEENGDIRDTFEKFFMDLYKSDGGRDWGNALTGLQPSITPEMNALLCSPFNNDEVKDAALHLGSLKAPGPDGFPGFFYNRFWHILNETIVCTASDFSEGNILLPQINKPILP